MKKRVKRARRVTRVERVKRIDATRQAKMKFLQKVLTILLIILIAAIVVTSIVLIMTKERPVYPEEEGLEGELKSLWIAGADAETGVYFPDSCSDENLKNVWESVLKLDSTGIIIRSNKNESDFCDIYLAYKVLDNNLTCFVWGEREDYVWEHAVDHYIRWIYANLTSSSINTLKSIDNNNIQSDWVYTFLNDISNGEEGVYDGRSIGSIEEADTEFSNIFKVENGTWEDYYYDYFSFNDKGRGRIFKNKTLDYFRYSKTIAKPIDLTQIKDIENFNLFKGGYYSNLIYLSEHFNSLGYYDSNLTITFHFSPAGIESYYIGYGKREVDFNIKDDFVGEILANFTISHPNWGNGANITSNNFYIRVAEPNFPKIPENCTNESLKQVWESVFRINSNGLKILNNESCSTLSRCCPAYLLYKTNGTILYALSGKTQNVTNKYRKDSGICAARLNSTQETINNFVSYFSSSVPCLYYTDPCEYLEILDEDNFVDRASRVENKDDATRMFNNTFKIKSIFINYESSEDLYSGVYYTWDVSTELRTIFMVGGEKEIEVFYLTNSSYDDVNLTKIKDIENITIYKNDNPINIIDLKDYVTYPSDSYVYVDDWEGRVHPNLTDNRYVSFFPDTNWYGNTTLYVYFNAGRDYHYTNTFYIFVVNTTRNSPPVFQSSCEDIDFDKNTNHTINMKSCFNDADNDSLTFTYTNMSITNISITENGTNLTLVPQTDFVGSGYFYINASDGLNATQGRVDIDVEEPGDDDDDNGGDDDDDDDNGGCTSQSPNITCGTWVCGSKRDDCNHTVVCGNCTAGKTCTNGACIIPAPRITSSSPPGNEFNITSNRSLTFSINAENYDTLEWYVDGVLVRTNVSSYEAKNLSAGSYEIKVIIKKGSAMDYKTWRLNVSKVKSNTKKLWLYILIGLIILIVVILVAIIIVKFLSNKKPSTTPSLFEIKEKPRDEDFKTTKNFEKQVQSSYTTNRLCVNPKP